MTWRERIIGNFVRGSAGWGWGNDRISIGRIGQRYEASVLVFGMLFKLERATPVDSGSGKLRQEISFTAEWDTGERSKVACAICGKLYPMIYGDKQGDDCASMLYERDGVYFIQGGYGSSRFDMDLFRFKNPPPKISADPVCDWCILKFWEDDMIEKIYDSSGLETLGTVQP